MYTDCNIFNEFLGSNDSVFPYSFLQGTVFLTDDSKIFRNFAVKNDLGLFCWKITI